MSVVVDASVLVAAMVDVGAEGRWAEEVIALNSLVAPHLVLAESANILRRLERERRISRLEATGAHEDMLRLDVVLFPFEPFAVRAWELRHGLTGYDAWYVAMAEALDVPFASLDRRLSRAPGPTCRFFLPS